MSELHLPNWNYICYYLAESLDEFRDVSVAKMTNPDWQYVKMLDMLWNIAFLKSKE